MFCSAAEISESEPRAGGGGRSYGGPSSPEGGSESELDWSFDLGWVVEKWESEVRLRVVLMVVPVGRRKNAWKDARGIGIRGGMAGVYWKPGGELGGGGGG